MSPRVRVLIAVALLGVVAGGCGALAFGYWETSRDCSGWVDAHGYQLVRDEWWAKTRGCVALTPAREEVYHDEEFRSKAIGWAWQFAIFGAGTLPAVIIVASGTLRWRRSSFREDP
ncbi:MULTISPECIES: hypothetical protein [unclassified Mycobacterium]|uniref:hypothetical protein n=1 Tax=unclassified Mycobacterium TaxID=2642494 RepID=UPI0018D37DE0|nr:MULTISPECIES: hypothetical protein [unclassified Mycobacterium]